MKGRKFDGIGKFEDIDIPDYCMDYLRKYKDILDEAVASVDEDSMNKFLMVKNLHRQRWMPDLELTV